MSDKPNKVEEQAHKEGPDRDIKRRPFSFFLRELIAVVTLLAIVMGLVLPAIAQIREATPRAQCQNNLKQLSLAILNYESAFKKLPIGIQVVPGRNDTAHTTAANWSWSVFVSAYIEQQKAYDCLNPKNNNCLSDRITASAYGTLLVPPANFQQPTFKGGTGGPGVNLQAVLTELNNVVSSAYVCPSDFAPKGENQFRKGVADSNGTKVTWPVTGVSFELGKTNYIAANSSRQCYALQANSANDETIVDKPDGIFDAVRARKFRDLRGGQSNIVLFSERISDSLTERSDQRRFGKIIPAGAATVFGCRGIGNSSIDGSSTNDVTDAWGAPDVLFSAWGGINLDNGVNPWRKFQADSSYHPRGVNIARADGSVEFFASVDVPAKLSEYGQVSNGHRLGSEVTGARKPLNVWQKLISISDATETIVTIPD